MTAMMLLLPLGLAWSCRGIGRRLRTDAVPVVRPRWLTALIGIAVLAACVTLGRTGLNFYECSVNRSPGHVCDGDLARFDISFQPLARATRDLAFQPVDLTHTPVARLESLGGRAERLMDVPSRLYRGFRLPDGHVRSPWNRRRRCLTGADDLANDAGAVPPFRSICVPAAPRCRCKAYK